MTPNDVGQQLHDKATRGLPLTPGDQVLLNAWYARLDEEERLELTPRQQQSPAGVVQAESNELLGEMLRTAQEIQALKAQIEQRRRLDPPTK
jgi:hypothetical protein